ncbi:MAG TPA: CBS domain-containing protein [Gemmatimonadales bacterium]|nr:CBS domain-containing protein [Gemmatimonadales bacterium]
MSTMPVTVMPSTSVSALITLFDRHSDIDAFPVIADDGVLRGIVSRLDILRAFRPDEELRMPNPRRVGETRVSAIMRHGVISVEPDDPLFAAADLMVETRFQSLPVVHRGGGEPVLVGILSRQALLQGLFSAGLK